MVVSCKKGKLGGICGDIGDVKALTTCPECKDGVEHRYCLRNPSKPSKSVASRRDMAQMKSQNIIPADSSYTAKSNSKFGPSKYLEQLHSSRSSNAQNNTSVQKAKDVKLTGDAEPKNLYAESDAHTVEDFCIEAAAERTVQTDPFSASWTGTFILKDEKTSIFLRTRPASGGRPKVKTFTKKMPEVLEFELCLYEDFLRTVFKGCAPNEEDIGLYFFPDKRDRSNVYVSLLKQLSGQYFLRSCIDGVDLLVFSSKVLHRDYSEGKKYDFLWGIFRHCHGTRKVAAEGKGTMVEYMNIDYEDADMEVDMVGGELVGTVDVVITKQSSVQTYGISVEAKTGILPTSNSNSAKVPRDFDLNEVPPISDEANAAIPTLEFNSAEVPSDIDINDVPPGFNQ